MISGPLQFHPSRGVVFRSAQSDPSYPSAISLASQAIISPSPQVFPRASIFGESGPVVGKKKKKWLGSFWAVRELTHFYIRPPLSLSLPVPSFHLFTTSLDVFILRMLDAWTVACQKSHFHCPPMVKMDFEWWAAIETGFAIFRRVLRVGWENSETSIS